MGKRKNTRTLSVPLAVQPRAGSTQSSSVSSDVWRFDFRTTALICAICVILTVSLYGSVITHPFINYDDEFYVAKNVNLRGTLGWHTFKWAFTSTYMANWHPITWLSHALDYQLFGDWAGGHHLVSLLIHIVNVLLLYLLLARGTGSTECSFWVALLFAVHPMNVESVAWVSERKNLLCTLFFLLTIGAYGRYARKPSFPRYLTMTLLFALGLASKPMLVPLPFVLLLLDYWPLQRIQGWTEPPAVFPLPQSSWSRLLAEKLPLVILSALSSLITVVAQADTALGSLLQLPLGIRMANAAHSYSIYIAKLFWPAGLAPLYPHPGRSLTFMKVGLSLLFLLAVSAVTWQLRRKHAFLLTGWLWYLGTLVPVIGLVQVGVQAMADRYLYIPQIGVFVMVVWGATELARFRKLKIPLRAAFVLAVAALWVTGLRQLRVWKTDYDLWSHTLAVTTNNYIAEDEIGTALVRMGNMDALAHFQNASRIAPDDPNSHGAIAGYLMDQGRMQEAIPNWQIAIRGYTEPDRIAKAEVNLAIIYWQIGSYQQARAAYRQAVTTDAAAVDEIVQDLRKMLEERPSAHGFLNLGLIYDVANQTGQARAAYERALQINPNLAAAKKALDTLQ